MGILQRLRHPSRATLNVTAGEATIFDALLVFDGGWRRPETRVLRGELTPFTMDLPDRDVTIVVQPRDHAQTVVAEYARERNGRRVAWGRSWLATPVLHRRGGSLICAGLPTSDGQDSHEPVACPVVDPPVPRA